MSLGLATALRNARLDAISTYAGASAILRIYDGTKPATGGTPTNLLSQHTVQGAFGGASTNGVLTLSAISTNNSANGTGTATWFRIVKSDGTTHVLDGTVSTVAAGSGDLQLDNTSIVSGGTVAITSATISEGNA